MKLRLDLLQELTMEDVLKDALANQHRYSPEPLFSLTGAGSLSPTSIEDYAKEEMRSTALIRKLKRRVASRGKSSGLAK